MSDASQLKLSADLEKKLKAMELSRPGLHESDEKLVIALDFGTTFSGIAFCFTNQRDTAVQCIADWPGAEGESLVKIPTLINYNDSGSSFDWGASVNRMQDSIVGVKLMLDPHQERPLYLPTGNIKRDIKKLPKPPIQIAADFIGAVYNHALRQISQKVPEDYMSICQKHFVLSVPAVWSDAAKSSTIQAAKQAGLFPVTLIKEPEAAALYTMHSLDFALKEGDAFVVCDAGGGTVDLISYEVVALTPKLQLKELVPGTGGMAGSLGLNQRFVESVKNLVGEDQYHELRKTRGFWLAEKTFDREVKKAFRGKPNEEFFINFPMATLDDDPDAGLESNTWRMTGKDLDQIFAPLITDILRLINDQIKSVQLKRPNQPITGVFLVGGFGCSQYLKSCIEREHPTIQVLQPTDAWSAIAKGAALSQLTRESTVVSTSSTRHFGLEAYSKVDPVEDVDQPTTKMRDGSVRTPRMTWYILKGEDITRAQEIKFHFYRDLSTDHTPDELIFEDALIECYDPEAPLHRSKGRKIGVNSTLTSNLQSVSADKFQTLNDPEGNPYIRITYDIVMTLKSALMELSLEVDGVKMGSIKPKFN